MKEMLPAALTILLVFIAFLANAQIYQYTDKNGNVVLTDKPDW